MIWSLFTTGSRAGLTYWYLPVCYCTHSPSIQLAPWPVNRLSTWPNRVQSKLVKRFTIMWVLEFINEEYLPHHWHGPLWVTSIEHENFGKSPEYTNEVHWIHYVWYYTGYPKELILVSTANAHWSKLVVVWSSWHYQLLTYRENNACMYVVSRRLRVLGW